MRKANKQALSPLESDYFLPRDFEYAQPLYDLAYILQIDSLANKKEIPEYRTFALWKAALSLDGYTSNVARWLSDSSINVLDYEPSSRIKSYLNQINDKGTLAELDSLMTPDYEACLRLRAIRGLGIKQIASVLTNHGPNEEWLRDASKATGLKSRLLLDTWHGTANTNWQAAHVVTPLLRLLHNFQIEFGSACCWEIPTIKDGLSEISSGFIAKLASFRKNGWNEVLSKTLSKDKFFKGQLSSNGEARITHQLGWSVLLEISGEPSKQALSMEELVEKADSLHRSGLTPIRGDLHSHTNWSDGAASLETMANAAAADGLEYLAITDHSRSSKIQGGLTPIEWVRQAVSLSFAKPKIKILHGIEADILGDGTVDMPKGLLEGMDIVVGSVHSSWSDDHQENANRLISAIETGLIDIVGHPTSSILGKPGVPNYYRPPVELDWERVFIACRKWSVALEFNCFPSRLDLHLPLLRKASAAGCWISFGSDAHSRAHLEHLKIATRVLPLIDSKRVLNLLSFVEIKKWLKSARKLRAQNDPEVRPAKQAELFSENGPSDLREPIFVRVATHGCVPKGSRIVGLDLTASKAKPTGAAVLDGMNTKTCSLETDEEILSFIKTVKPSIVSIDSPLGLPGGGSEIVKSSGIMRVAEYDLNSIGIPAYPALIDSMKPLTLRGIGLRRRIEALPNGPKVIESYPGAAQDVLCIPRKQRGLDLLRTGLRELGLKGAGLKTESHDEMDAITSAIVGRFWESGKFEPMGIRSEAQLIVPKLQPLHYEKMPIICLAGKTGAGKSVIARYLALYYGFYWLRTREIIRALLVDDLQSPISRRIYGKPIKANEIQEADLRDFGIIILERFKQLPLIKKLKEMAAQVNEPVIVDAVRDVADFQSLAKLTGEATLWFIDTPDSVIRSRAEQRKNSKPLLGSENRIDQKMALLKENAPHRINNDSSLEELRWAVDDALFHVVRLKRR